eukprot:4435820-Alexandrium_andersonii.AAC.1
MCIRDRCRACLPQVARSCLSPPRSTCHHRCRSRTACWQTTGRAGSVVVGAPALCAGVHAQQ